MDFRQVSPESVAWGTAFYRGQPQARAAGGARVTVQTPPCACRVSAMGSGMYRLDMTVREDVASHAAFAEWIRGLEAAAAGSEALAAWRGDKGMSTTLFRGNARFTAFSDTMVFDRDGKVSADLMDAAGCTCLLELTGCWSSEARWGLRWKLCQVKFDVVSPTLPILAMDGEDDGPKSAAGAPDFAFVDE